MIHRVYTRDWYFNAGIIGFLKVIVDDKKFEDIKGLKIGENFIEFENSVLDDFEEKFVKQAFLKFFKKNIYLTRLEKNLKEIEKKKKIKLDSEIEKIEKSPYENFLKLLDVPIDDSQNKKELVSKLEKSIESLKKSTDLKIFNILDSKEDGKKSISNFVKIKLKGICSPNIEKYIEDISIIDDKKKLKSHEICLSCQTRKATKNFNNAISNIIGFNKDNSNWSWGYKSDHIKICPVCCLIYNCAFISFVYILRKVEQNWLNYFYLMNYNANLKEFYQKVEEFELELNQNSDKAFYVIIREMTKLINLKHVDNIRNNINFIEIVDNPILKGQSTKGYNVYNYNLDKDIATFLYPFFFEKKFPIGFYKIKDTYYPVDEELLKLAIQRQIDYQLVYKFINMTISKSIETKYNLQKIVFFIFEYIQKMKGKKMDNKTASKKGFKSGIDLRNKLFSAKKENQIDGLIYGFLNDLKLGDREKFLDKYIRTIMSHRLPSLFAQSEMLDTDSFFQFGYSFVNGLLYIDRDKEENDKNNDNNKLTQEE
ncbi:MAG: type I-B CRISPR-associated protein Cas8b1/Cst1 [Desulfobacterales bacterium]|nr:type I-B CRISPR-associated protein Cas8b1/Cst1 [Desulfobacterales bacterium]